MARRTAQRATVDPAQVPVVGPREPCPCGSGKKYRNCHGKEAARRADRPVARPFEGLASEADVVALRELVPAATAPLQVEGHADRTVTLATVLPGSQAALVRQDGSVLLGLQTTAPGSGDPSRDLAAALLEALGAAPGAVVAAARPDEASPRLQDLLGDQVLDVTVHDGYGFWFEGTDGLDEATTAALAQADAAILPTARLSSVTGAYWAGVTERNHLRWVMTEPEDVLLDALARLHAAGADGLGEGTRYVGSFRAAGLLVPVWDLPVTTGAEELEGPAAAFAARLGEALAATAPLTSAERGARAGLLSRQVTLR